MDTLGIIFTVVLAVALVLVGFYFLGRKLQKKTDESQKMINQNKQTIQGYVIDKKKMKIQEANFPQSALQQVPWYVKIRKLPFAKVKVGPQIVTMMVEGKVFDSLPTKQNLKLEISGAYILGWYSGKKGAKKPEAPAKMTWRERIMARAKGEPVPKKEKKEKKSK